jgi:hypothetical protein
MSFEIRQPNKLLKPYIRHLAISRAESPNVYQVLPDTALVIGFQFSGRLSQVDGNVDKLYIPVALRVFLTNTGFSRILLKLAAFLSFLQKQGPHTFSTRRYTSFLDKAFPSNIFLVKVI